MRRPGGEAQRQRRVLVLRPGAIGDTILTLPALAALRRALPEASIIVAGNPAALPLVEATGLIDGWMSFDDARVTRLYMPGPPQPSDAYTGLTAAVAWCADPDGMLQSGLHARGAQVLVVAPSRPPGPEPEHVGRYLLRTVEPLTQQAAMPDFPELPDVVLPAWAVEQAARFLSAAGLEGRQFIMIHPGSGSPRKNWPPEQFAAVVRRFGRQTGRSAVVVAGPADAPVLQRLACLLPAATPLLSGQPLLVTASVLRQARGFLGNDSGLSHLAGLLGVPTLALFGPTDPALWRPLGPRVRVLRSQPLADLPADEVLAALDMLLASQATS